MDEEDGEDWPEEQIYFTGECTCIHVSGAHGWASCEMELPDGTPCPCEAGWEE